MNLLKKIEYKMMIKSFEKACKKAEMNLVEHPKRMDRSYLNDNYAVSFEGSYNDIVLYKMGFSELVDKKCWIPIYAYENQAKFVKNARPMYSYNKDVEEILTFLGLEEFKIKEDR